MSSSANSYQRSERRDVKVIRHFSHQHPLRLRRLMGELMDCPECSLCGSLEYASDELIYWCEECDFFIHTSCAAYPQHTTHPFHPQHALSLCEYKKYNNWDKKVECNACGQQILSSSSPAKLLYHCLDCKFYLDSICLDLTPESNPQPLVFVCCAREKYGLPSCSFCHHTIYNSKEIYVCLDRKSILHEECFRLARQIVHPFHPDHPLSLLPRYFLPIGGSKMKCNACYAHHFLTEFIYYKCLECEFVLHTWCASLVPTKSSYVDQPLITTHSHPLIQCGNVDNLPFRCSACSVVIKDSVFVCLQCCILLDTSCAQLSREIRHPLHHHSLQLVETLNRELRNNCRVCKVHRQHIFMYTCRMCDFLLDIGCAKKTLTNNTKTLMSSVHRHLLAFLETPLDEHVYIKCDKCPGLCNKNYFQCVGDSQCYFTFHLECCPLPQTIKHDCHCDPLTLTYDPIEDIDEYEYDADIEFYCHACEELRDPDLPTYCCKECPFIAHLHCVLSEIFRYIEAGPSTVSPEVGIAGASTGEKFVEVDFCVPEKDTTQEDTDVLDQKNTVEENNASVDDDAIKKEIAAVNQEIEGLQIRIEQLKVKRSQLIRLTAVTSAEN